MVWQTVVCGHSRQKKPQKQQQQQQKKATSHTRFNSINTHPAIPGPFLKIDFVNAVNVDVAQQRETKRKGEKE